MKLRWLDSVKLDRLHPAMIMALFRIDETFTQELFGDQEVWITSGNDASHKPESKHYSGRAFDFRTHNIKGIATFTREALISNIVESLKKKLGPQFFIQVEDLNGSNEHLHVQFNGI